MRQRWERNLGHFQQHRRERMLPDSCLAQRRQILRRHLCRNPTQDFDHEWNPGTIVNLEQPLTAGKEFGGHFVLGHVDTVGHVTRLEPEGENWWYAIEVPEDFARNIVPQGSITMMASASPSLAGTMVSPKRHHSLHLRTHQHHHKKAGDAVNLEGDILGKYVERYLEARKPRQARIEPHHQAINRAGLLIWSAASWTAAFTAQTYLKC